MKPIALASVAAIAVLLAPVAFAEPAAQPQVQPAPQSEPMPAPAPDPAAADTHAPTAASGNTRLAALVPTGLTPEDACRGFKDLSECSAALHVAQNLNIPFADLKDRVTSGQSLGTAIHALKPKADSKREAQRAGEQAREDLRTTG